MGVLLAIEHGEFQSVEMGNTDHGQRKQVVVHEMWGCSTMVVEVVASVARVVGGAAAVWWWWCMRRATTNVWVGYGGRALSVPTVDGCRSP